MQVLAFILLLSLFVVLEAQAAVNTVVYPDKQRTDYRIELLKLALSYHHKNKITLKAYGASLPKHRSFELLANNQGIDVIYGGATLSREQDYLAIRFPILKGLHGWRIPLIHKTTPHLFKDVQTFTQFKMLSAGQFNTWSDTKVLRANQIIVATTSDYEGLYTMLHKQRFDYFPRSVIEVESNYQQFEHLDIMIDSHIFIHYPSAYYFYVRKDNIALANIIKNGLIQAKADGNFDRLFDQYYGALISKYSGQSRQVISLSNPYLSDKTPLADSSLWLSFN